MLDLKVSGGELSEIYTVQIHYIHCIQAAQEPVAGVCWPLTAWLMSFDPIFLANEYTLTCPKVWFLSRGIALIASSIPPSRNCKQQTHQLVVVKKEFEKFFEKNIAEKMALLFVHIEKHLQACAMSLSKDCGPTKRTPARREAK